MTITEEFRKRLADAGIGYTAGYVCGGRRVSTEVATNVVTKDGGMVSFEELEGTLTAFDLTLEQACKVAETI